jgi:deoxyribodipyrimidine photo-lyase
VQRSAGCVIGHEYPAPIVDHAAAVREAKRRLAVVLHFPATRAEARGVARRHGSRRDRRGAMQQDPVRRKLGDEAAPPRRRKRPAFDAGQRLLPFASPGPDGEIGPPPGGPG